MQALRSSSERRTSKKSFNSCRECRQRKVKVSDWHSEATSKSYIDCSAMKSLQSAAHASTLQEPAAPSIQSPNHCDTASKPLFTTSSNLSHRPSQIQSVQPRQLSPSASSITTSEKSLHTCPKPTMPTCEKCGW
jgi:hypothetical protein